MHLFLIAFGYVTTCGHGYYCRDAFVLDCFWLLVKVANDESHTHIFSSRLSRLSMQHSCNTPSTLSISEGGTNLGHICRTEVSQRAPWWLERFLISTSPRSVAPDLFYGAKSWISRNKNTVVNVSVRLFQKSCHRWSSEAWPIVAAI